MSKYMAKATFSYQTEIMRLRSALAAHEPHRSKPKEKRDPRPQQTDLVLPELKTRADPPKMDLAPPKPQAEVPDQP